MTGLLRGRPRLALVLVVAFMAALFVLGMGSAALAAPETVIAWIPSHQDDNGTNGWHEYQVCGDIVQRTMALLPDFTNVLCWETGMGLTSHNDPALQSEIDQAVAGHAQIYIAVHVNGGAPSGLAGCYYSGESLAARYADAILVSMSATTGLRYRYTAARSDLYQLNPANNPVPLKILLELGDNVADYALLSSPDGRQMLAAALAKAVRENTPLPPLPPRCEETDRLIAYTGAWVNFPVGGASGGAYLYADSAASATVYFDGTRLDWIATKGVTMGLATVSLDGGAPITVNLYNSVVVRQKLAWSTGTLNPGVHKLVIRWTGKRSVASGGTRVNIDALDVEGNLAPAPPPPPPPPAPTRYEQTLGEITYTGSWVNFPVPGASGGSYLYANSAASATVYFAGTRLDWIATKGVTMGLATVTLDTNAPITVNLYNSVVVRQKLAWSTGTLPPGPHKVVIRWTGKRAVTSGGTRVNIDAVDIVGTLTQAPK